LLFVHLLHLILRYGKVKEIDIKTPPRPPAFAFVTFEDEDDASDAVKGRSNKYPLPPFTSLAHSHRDGYEFDGNRLRVEFSKGGKNDRDRPARGGPGGKRRSDWRVLVTNLPRSTSWQDLKDFMRKGGDVIYADVNPHGEGVVEYSNEYDMEEAIYKLDDTEFRNGSDSAYVRVKSDHRGRERERDSRSHRTRSPSYDRSRRRSRSRDRSDSRDRDRDRHTSSRRSRRDSRDETRKRSPSRSPSPPDDRPPHSTSEAPVTEKRDDDKDKRDNSPRRSRRGSSSGSERDSRKEKKKRKHRHHHRDRDHSRSPSSSRDRSHGSGR
jgi:splicing factor, arginine/serine-rich 1